MQAECIITGVMFIHPETTRAYHGDLFVMGPIYIANVNMRGEGEEIDVKDTTRKWIMPTRDWWERHGVWVFATTNAVMSHASYEYISKDR
jgi:hypothetical protein